MAVKGLIMALTASFSSWMISSSRGVASMAFTAGSVRTVLRRYWKRSGDAAEMEVGARCRKPTPAWMLVNGAAE